MEQLTCDDLKAVFERLARLFEEHRAMLCELDGALGDGDIGLPMQKGFAAARDAIAPLECRYLGDIFKAAGMAFIRHAPSTMGTLVGSGFLKAAPACAQTTSASVADMAAILHGFIDGIQARGKASRGEKTILDSLWPAADALDAAAADGRELRYALLDASRAAARGAEETTALVARHGRAAWFGDQSAGKKDPGTIVGALLIQAFTEHAQEA